MKKHTHCRLNLRGQGLLVPLALASLLTLGACGDDGSDAGGFGAEFNNDFGDDFPNNDFNNDAPNNTPNNDPNNDVFIPEEEERFNFLAPQPSRNYVFVANTNLDTVAKIDADTLEITSVEVGDGPTVVRTWKETNVAVVLNEGSADVSIIHARPERDEVVTLPVRAGFNQLVMAPGGRFALAYLDYANVESGDDNVGLFQDVNLIRLEEGAEAVHNVAVGFRVLEVEFDDDGQRAFVITEDGISVINLEEVDEDTSARPRRVTEDPNEDAQAVDREVEITGDGRLALVRTSQLEGLNVIDLTRDAAPIQIPLAGVPTDLDIYPDSTRALTVLRGARQVVRMNLAEVLDDPEAIEIIEVPDGPLGLAALDELSDTALLSSIASGDPRVSRLDLNTGDLTIWDVRKALSGVHLSPDASRAVLFHVRGDAPRTNDPADVFIAQSWAYSMLDISTGFIKLQTSPTEPGEFVFSPDSQIMFVVLNDKAAGVRQVDRVDLGSFRVDTVALGSPPEHIGILPSADLPRVYVSQEHPVGRMTFIDIDSGDARTVTGYELNSRIE